MQLISPYGNRQPKQLWFQPWPHLSPQSFLRTIPCGCLHLKLTKCIKNNTFKCLSAEYFQHKSTKVKLETHELAPPAVNMLPTIKSNVDRLSWVVPDQHYLCPLSSCKWWSGNVKIPSTCTQVAPVISSSAVSMPPPPTNTRAPDLGGLTAARYSDWCVSRRDQTAAGPQKFLVTCQGSRRYGEKLTTDRC